MAPTDPGIDQNVRGTGGRFVDTLLRKRTGGIEEHPVEGHATEAQREPQAGLGDDTHPDRQENATSDHTTTA